MDLAIHKSTDHLPSYKNFESAEISEIFHECSDDENVSVYTVLYGIIPEFFQIYGLFSPCGTKYKWLYVGSRTSEILIITFCSGRTTLHSDSDGYDTFWQYHAWYPSLFAAWYALLHGQRSLISFTSLQLHMKSMSTEIQLILSQHYMWVYLASIIHFYNPWKAPLSDKKNRWKLDRNAQTA